jgi:hypothetical protein
MNSRALLVVFGCSLASAFADSAATTYQRTESFDTKPRNWHLGTPTQFYGYTATHILGGTGAAGGYLMPTTSFNYYGDTYLSGAVDRTTPLSASGRLVLRRTSGTPPYVASGYLAHFNKQGGKFIQVVGIALTGSTSTTVVATPILQFSNGGAYEGDAITLTVGNDPVSWSYQWTPGGGPDGCGELAITIDNASAVLDLPSDSVGSNYSLNAFGLFQPPFSSPDSNTFLELYAGNLKYTALPGKPPTLHVLEPKNNTPGEIIVGDGVVAFSGTAKTHLGNKVAAIRYRVIHNGKRGRLRSAKGTTSWTANVRVPSGISTIEFTARSDSGLTRTVKRKVQNFF